MKNFAREIKKLRLEEQLSQNDFANKIGCSRSYLGDIESGRTPPSRSFLEKVAAAYGHLSVPIFSFELSVKNIIKTKVLRDQFIYIFTFTQEGIEGASERLKNCFHDCFIEINVATIKTDNQLLRAITKKNGSSLMLFDVYRELTSNQDLIVILTGFSDSKIKDKAKMLRCLIKESAGATLIVIDKPSFLEKNYDLLSYYAIPFYYH